MENQQSSVAPVSNVPNNINNPRDNSKRLLIIFVIVLALVAVGVLSYTLGTHNYQLNKNINQDNNSLATQQIISTPTTVIPGNAQVVIKPITIRTGINLSKYTQDSPYKLKTGKGHYLLEIYATKKLIYDGQTVYANNDLQDIALSSNGLHYAYTTRAGNTTTLYIDGQKVMATQNLKLPAIADDGKTYFYVLASQTGVIGEETLIQNDKQLYSAPQGFLNLWIGNDGTNYLAELRSLTNNYFNDVLVYNGVEIYRGSELKKIVLSANGKHYGYITAAIGSQQIVVDGSIKFEANQINFMELTSLGHFSFSAGDQSQVYVDAKLAAVDPSATSAHINDDTTHILTNEGNRNSNNWRLDNKPIKVDNTNGGFEFDGNTLYVYGLTN